MRQVSSACPGGKKDSLEDLKTANFLQLSHWDTFNFW